MKKIHTRKKNQLRSYRSRSNRAGRDVIKGGIFLVGILCFISVLFTYSGASAGFGDGPMMSCYEYGESYMNCYWGQP